MARKFKLWRFRSGSINYKVQIYVDAEDGEFSATVAEQGFRDDTLEGLQAQLRPALIAEQTLEWSPVIFVETTTQSWHEDEDDEPSEARVELKFGCDAFRPDRERQAAPQNGRRDHRRAAG